MIYSSELFTKYYKLKEVLPKEELYTLLKEAKKGNIDCRNKIVEHNLKLIIYRINTKFKYLNYDMEELISIASVGIIKAIKNFDLNRNIDFSTYVVPCIDNEILLMLRKNKNINKTCSLNESVFESENSVVLEDLLADPINFTETIETNELYQKIKEIISNLPTREQYIIVSYFGLYNNAEVNQKELAEKLDISQPTISRTIKKILKEIRYELIDSKFLEKPSKIKTKK